MANITGENTSNGNLNNSSSFGPEDYKYMAYFIMFYLGVGNLFPWNAFISAASYYAQRFCGTSVEESFENYFSITYSLSQTIGLAFSVMFADRLTMKQKIAPPLWIYSGIFALTTLLVIITSVDGNSLFAITLISACFCGLCGAVLSGGLFSLAAMLPSAYTGALMNGQGLAGLIVTLAGVFTQLLGEKIDDCTDDSTDDDGECDNTINGSALGYFMIATIILISCVFAFFTLMRLEFTKYYLQAAGEEDLDTSEIVSPLLSAANDPNSTAHATGDRTLGGDVALSGNHQFESVSTPIGHEPVTIQRILQVFKLIYIPAISVWLTFSLTIGVFPSLTVLIESVDKCSNSARFYNDLFTPFMFVLFNLFDLVGRMLAGRFGLNLLNQTGLISSSLLRLVFFPLFMLCNVRDSELGSPLNSDVWPILFMIGMSLTNGFVSSTSMMMGPSLVERKEDAGLAGTIMIFSLTFGLLTGSCLSFIVVIIATGSL